jgi:UDP-GlcNAc:undecaprenyl-phosphate GlcNAc-1-phosphate transferase
MILACLVAAGITAIAIVLLRRLAKPLDLIDHPDARKLHDGGVPLVGGLAIGFGVLAGTLSLGIFQHFGHCLLTTSAVIVLLGALDDRRNLSVRVRLFVQVATIVAMMAATDSYVRTLGLFFGHELSLGWVGIPFTIVAVIGLLNAFNMLDGIDGLAGAMSLVAIAAILVFINGAALRGATALMCVLAAAILPYLVFNLGPTRRKIFMGDAGSMAIGYLLAWTLIRLSQGPQSFRMLPADVLWCVALPVLDTLAVMYRRLRHGKSPFKPDRGHIHHLLLGFGMRPRAALLYLTLAAALLAAIGLGLHLAGNGPSLMSFVIVLMAYAWVTDRMWMRLETQHRIFIVTTAANDETVDNPITAPGASFSPLPGGKAKR